MKGNQFVSMEKEDKKYSGEERQEKQHHKSNKHVRPTEKAVRVFLRGSKLRINGDWEA